MRAPVFEIKPAPRANPEGLKTLPWNIFRDGRCTNTGTSYDDAYQKADKAREKLGGIWATDEVAAEAEVLEGTEATVLVKRPKGAPDIGAMVEEIPPFAKEGEVVHGKVIIYLSTQFVIQTETGCRIIHVQHSNWKEIPNAEG